MKTFQQEVVSGGTQKPMGEGETPDTIHPGLGIGAWVLLFVVIYRTTGKWGIVFALGIAVSILAHEWGHYWTAKRSGMKATQFFLGFGPRIWSTHRNGVEWGVRLLPLGGFVKIIGMTNVDEVSTDDEPYTYRQATYPRRMWVITAGSVMHMIIALLIIVPVYAFIGTVQNTETVELWRISDGSPADDAGLVAGDIVTALDGEPVTSADDFRSALGAYAPGTTVEIAVLRGEQELLLTPTLVQHPDFEEVRGFLGVNSSDEQRVPIGLGEAIVQGPEDLVVNGFARGAAKIAQVINPVNVWGHLTGTADDPTTRPGTIVGATQISEDIGAFGGWPEMLVFLAGLNVSLGVLNMFPLIPLDGGHAAIATYERLRSRGGKRYFVDMNKLMPVAAVCLALIAFMFLTGLYLDIVKG